MPKLAKIRSKEERLHFSCPKTQAAKVKMSSTRHHATTLLDSSVAARKMISKLVEKYTEDLEMTSTEEFETEFSCSNCSGLLYHPVTAFCGHSFCSRCSKSRVYCNHCYKNVEPSSLSKMNIVLNTIIERCYPKQYAVHALISEGDNLLEQLSFQAAESKYTQAIKEDHRQIYAICKRALARERANKLKKAFEDVVLIKLHSTILPERREKFYTEEKSRRTSLEKEILRTVVQVFLESLSVLDGRSYVPSIEQEEFVDPLSGYSPLHDKHFTSIWSPGDLSPSAMSPVFRGPTTHVDQHDDVSDLERMLDAVISSAVLTFEAHCDEDRVCTKPRSNARVEVGENGIDESDFCCVLCTRLFYEPLCTPCGHTFCFECLERCFDHSTACPMCKTSLKEIYLYKKHLLSIDWSLNSIMKQYLPKMFKEGEDVRADEIRKLRESLPLFICTVGLPSVPCMLHVYEPRYRLMLRRAIKVHDGKFGMTTSSKGQPSKVGTILDVKNMSFFPGGRSIVTSVGTKRFEIVASSTCDGYNTAKVQYIVDEEETDEREAAETQIIANEVYKRAKDWFEPCTSNFKHITQMQYGEFPEQDQTKGDDGPKWAWWVLAMVPVKDNIKLYVLAKRRLRERLAILNLVLKKLERTRKDESSRF